MSHTPTPWQARWGSIRHAGQRDTLSRCVIGTPKNKNGGSFVVCAIEGPFAGNEAQAKANATFIVEACNAHERLKAALKKLSLKAGATTFYAWAGSQPGQAYYDVSSKVLGELHEAVSEAEKALTLCEEGGKG